MTPRFGWIAAPLLIAACGAEGIEPTDGAPKTIDVGVKEGDAGAESDATISVDSGHPDSGSDAGVVDAGGPTDTWNSFAASFFTEYCVGCHDTGNSFRDYNLYADAFRDRETIRCGVAPGPDPAAGCVGFPPPAQFPVGSGPFPTDPERTRIVVWVENGAPEN